MGGKAMGRVILLFLAVLIFSGCRNKEYVTVEKTTTDTLYKYRVRVDSIVKFDSITTMLKGDTVFRDRWHTLHVYHTEVDTVFQIKMVKEPQPYPVIKPVEVNKLYWWQNRLMWAGSLFSLICIVYGLINIYRLKHNSKS